MRILNLAAGEKWTGLAAVVFDQTAAIVRAGLEAQFAFVRDSPLAERLEEIGWARPLFQRPPRWPADYAQDIRRLRETIARERFDIVHAHGSHDHWVAAWAAAATPARVVRTIHHLRHAHRGVLSWPLRARTVAFAFANRQIARAFGAAGPIHSPVVDADRFHPGGDRAWTRARFGLPEATLLVGTVGKLAPGRGHDAALEAMARLPDAAAVHVGHGQHAAALRERAAHLGAADRNYWTGYQEASLPELYRSWDVFLFTASGSEQGQRAILEAMASGLPVVALDLPGVRDLITDGKEGFLVERPEELSERMSYLLESADLRRRMGVEARTRALDFTAEKFAAKAREFYCTVTHGSPGGTDGATGSQ